MVPMEPDWSALVPEVTLRVQQEDALHRLFEAFYVEGKQVVMLEAPTGVGKSIIQLALARYEESKGGSSYVVTPQRQLQDQMRGWERLRVMKGRGSYECELVQGHTAANAPCLLSSKAREANPDSCSDQHCPYFTALRLAKESPTVVHNYASLLAQANIGRHFGPRSLLCLDEGHTAVSWVRNYMACEFTPVELRALSTSGVPTDPARYTAWLRCVLSFALLGGDEIELPKGTPDSMIGTLLKVAAHPKDFGLVDEEDYDQAWSEARSAGSDREDFEFNLFKDSGTVPWVSQFSEPDRWHPEGQWSTIPLRVAPMANVLTRMGSKVLIVSATILNKALMCAELGLKVDDTEMVRIDSAFDVKNRPIVKSYAGSMSYRNKARTTPELIERLARIAGGGNANGRHANQQGIVHTVSHALAWDIANALKERLPSRPIVVVPRGPDRDYTIARFLSGGLGPTAILVGPALAEGVDAKDDAARWQAMCKAPWPSKNDPVVSYLTSSNDPNRRRWGEAWYMWKAAQQTVQAFGRVVRSATDYGTTYLLDSDFDRIINSGYLPEYVKDAVQ